MSWETFPLALAGAGKSFSAESWPRELQIGVIAVVLLLASVLIAYRLLKRRREAAGGETLNLKIDVNALAAEGPRGNGPVLEFYNLPVRVVALVLAPAGRGSEMPPQEKLPTIAEQLLPSLMDILDEDHPQFRIWPEQLSSEGFARAFFSNAALPGDRGKGTPWCSAAGRFEADGQQLLAGIVCRGEKDNGLGQVIIQRSGQWLDVFRVRR